jgi:predicted NAD/FAD-binding protein
MSRTHPLGVKKIAVIGGGIAGLGAAWSLSRRHEVTLFERGSRLGGHANTVTLDLDGRAVPVDTGFIVYNAPNYPNLVALFDRIGVASDATDMSFGVSLDSGRLEYAGTNLRGLFAQPSNAMRGRFWLMLRDIRRFYASAAGYLADGVAGISIAELLAREAYSRAFIDDHLIPMAAAIWSASQRDIERYPAAAFIRFFDNHGLLSLGERPQWRTVSGGSENYVARVLADATLGIRAGARIAGIRRDGGGVTIRDSGGDALRFDAAVIATHADEALHLLEDPSRHERDVLRAFDYSNNVAYLHEDPALMPRRRAAWASWNYLRDTARAEQDAPLCVTYWMNQLQRLATTRNLFVTLNPPTPPQARLTHGVYHYEHPIFTARTTAAQERSRGLQGAANTWFCGSYLGHGFHEDALQSGLWVAEQLGCERPWADAGTFDRLPTSYREAGEYLPVALSA